MRTGAGALVSLEVVQGELGEVGAAVDAVHDLASGAVPLPRRSSTRSLIHAREPDRLVGEAEVKQRATENDASRIQVQR